MDKKLIVSLSPHIGARTKTRNIMLDVIIALIPALIASVIIFGPRTLVVTCATVAACVLAEYICRKVMKRDNTVGDLSAIVTGMLLSFNLPSGIPIWIAVLGGVIAIVVVKQMFGGLGQNFVNPAAGSPYYFNDFISHSHDNLAGRHGLRRGCRDNGDASGNDRCGKRQ